MTRRGDRTTFRNEDLVLKVTANIDPAVWDESRYEAFLGELCGTRGYQEEAIRTTLRYLLGGRYANLRELAQENFEQNPELEPRYGSWSGMERHLQLPDQLSCSLDQATATGKSYVLYGLAAILLAEGAVDRVLVLCPSNTIEAGLLGKFKELAANADLRDLLPADATVRAPKIINASETIVDGSICVENYHAILETVKSSIRDSLRGRGERVAVLNDEAHHVANESGTNAKRWKEFLLIPDYGFRIVVGVSGTCYVGDEYFADVVHRYSLRQAIEERFVKKVEYVAEMPETDNPDETLATDLQPAPGLEEAAEETRHPAADDHRDQGHLGLQAGGGGAAGLSAGVGEDLAGTGPGQGAGRDVRPRNTSRTWPGCDWWTARRARSSGSSRSRC